jgi:hypothetical protein
MGTAAMAQELPPCPNCDPEIGPGPSIQVYAEIYKDKNVLVCEDVDILKEIRIDVSLEKVYNKAAEALALTEQVNEDNQACENCAEKKSLIVDSIFNQTGVTTVNQATGNMNNQGNVLAFAVDFTEAPDPGAFANAEASAHQDVFDNDIDSSNILFRDSLIQSSVNDNTGITLVNQAAGQGNNQLNQASIAVALGGTVSLAEADLGQTVAGNSVFEDFAFKTAVVTNSIRRNSGVTFVNQHSGNNGNQGHNLAMAVVARPELSPPPTP